MTKDKKELTSKLNKLTAGKKSAWLEEYSKLRSRKKSRKRSQHVALQILRTLRYKNISQKELAERLEVSPQQVSKWVKGKENFTFDTIANIEDALGITLMEVSGGSSQKDIDKSLLIKMLPKSNDEVNYIVKGEEKTICLKADKTNEWNNKRKYPYS